MKHFAKAILAGVALTATFATATVVQGEYVPGTYPNMAVDVLGRMIVSLSGPISILPLGGNVTNRSGTITTGGTSQQVMPANANRKYLLLQNIGDVAMWCDFGVNAVQSQPSIMLLTGMSFIMEGTAVSNDTINCVGATAGKPFVAKEM